jgi:hypothetical protein
MDALHREQARPRPRANSQRLPSADRRSGAPSQGQRERPIAGYARALVVRNLRVPAAAPASRHVASRTTHATRRFHARRHGFGAVGPPTTIKAMPLHGIHKPFWSPSNAHAHGMAPPPIAVGVSEPFDVKHRDRPSRGIRSGSLSEHMAWPSCDRTFLWLTLIEASCDHGMSNRVPRSGLEM